MFSRWPLFSAALLVVGSALSAQEPPCSPVQATAVCSAPVRRPIAAKIYPVADLVVPTPGDIEAQVTRGDRWVINRPNSNHADPMARVRLTHARAQQLMRSIGTHITPASWKPAGGQGTMDYFPLSQAVVIQQTPEVHERIEAYLARMRKQREHRDCQVVLEVRLMSVTEGFSKTVLQPIQGLKKGKRGGKEPVLILSDLEVFLLLRAAQEDSRTNVLQTPKLCTLNNRKATLRIDGFKINLHPKISADRRSITVATDCTITNQNSDKQKQELRHKVVATIPNGKTIVIHGFGPIERVVHPPEVPVLTWVPSVKRVMRTAGPVKENVEYLLMVTPRIVVTEEEEERHVVRPMPVRPRPRPVVRPAPRVPPPPAYRTQLATPPIPPPLPRAQVPPMQAKTAAKVHEYLKEYDRACREGDEEAALKFGKRALRLDPTCFVRPRPSLRY
jgi:hypothetical protein